MGPFLKSVDLGVTRKPTEATIVGRGGKDLARGEFSLGEFPSLISLFLIPSYSTLKPLKPNSVPVKRFKRYEPLYRYSLRPKLKT